MKILTKIIAAAVSTAALFGACAHAADSYPGKPIRLVVGFAPGGATDVLARTVASRLSEKLHGNVVVENRTGAGGLIAGNFVAKSAPDGYTLAFASTGAFSIGPSLYKKKLPYDPIKDFTPVALVSQNTHVLVVNPSVPAKTVAELVAYAKSKPGALSYGSFGNGSTSHLLAEQFKKLAGVDAVHIPYAGSPAMVTATMTGDVAFAVDTLQSSLPYIRSGKLRALAVISPDRSPVAPEIPTFKEAGYADIDLKNWYGIVAPAGTPAEVVDILAKNITEIVGSPDFRDFVSRQGGETATAQGPEFGAFLAVQEKRWGGLVKASGATVD
ncbi:MAG TPA: tripartite tricarboxylate transporter substrate binding protein [Bordetella sp.]